MNAALRRSVALLSRLVSTQSFSRQEEATADILEQWLTDRGVAGVERQYNNVWALAPGYDPSRPTLMLNSHHDTVRPAATYTRDPFEFSVEGDRLYGLGSNDAGASVVTLAETFIGLSEMGGLPFNLLLALTAAEEVMGEHGMRTFLPMLADRGVTPDMVIVGEPTGMQPAVAERGLVVLDGVTKGRSGHAARQEGINALYLAIDDIDRLRSFRAPTESGVLGPLRISVTQINAGTQHNVVPDTCRYVVDVRTTDAYTNEETVGLLRGCVRHSELTPRSTRVQPSVLDAGHPLVRASIGLGLTPFVSMTTSDMALMHGLPSLKIGPGDSARSHTADEYVLISEISAALTLYPELITTLTKYV